MKQALLDSLKINEQLYDLLDQLKGQDSRSVALRGHVLGLAEALGIQGADKLTLSQKAVTSRPAPKQSGNAPRPPSVSPSQRPGLQTSRRAARQLAGHTLKSVATMAHTTLPTVRMYEAKRTAVRPDKRHILDELYATFMPKLQSLIPQAQNA